MSASSAAGAPHFVIVAVGSRGDMYPFLALARALQRRGHRISFLAPTVHRDCVDQAQVPFHGLGSDADYFSIVNDPLLWHPRKGLQLLLRSLRFGAPDIDHFLATLGPQRCVLLAHPLVLPALDLSRAARPQLRVVAVYLAPANLRTVHDPLSIGPMIVPRWVPLRARRWLWSRIDRWLVDPIVLPDLNQQRRRLGLAPVSHFFEHLYRVADLSLTLFPDWFGPAQPDWPTPLRQAWFPLYDPHRAAPFSPGLAAFLAAGDAPLVFTPGTGNRHAAAYFRHALRACLRLGRRAIFLTTFADQLPAALPPTVLWQAYVPLAALLPHAAALVHHGGIGTTAEALRAGLPQLVVPLAYDQFDNGARVRALGVGDVLPASRLNSARLARALAALLAAAPLRQRCQAMAQRMAAPADEDGLCVALERV